MTDDDNRDDAFARAWEDREMRELYRDLGPIFRQHGAGMVDRSFARAEQQRVATLLGNDRAYRAGEQLRQAAQLQVENGEYTNIADSVSVPTPEQFAQARRHGAGFRRRTPRQPDGTVRTVIAYRRQDIPQAYKMLMAGVIDRAGFAACKWYRDLFEATGLSGGIKSINYGREVFAAPQSMSMFSDFQVEQQDTFRFVRSQIEARSLALLDRMVLQDVPIYRAARSVGGSWRKAQPLFRTAVELLQQARENQES